MKYAPASLKDIIQNMKTNLKDERIEVEKAFEFVAKHLKDNNFLLQHSLNTAQIVSSLGVDTTTIVAALLHCCVRKNRVKAEEIEKLFGREVKELVERVAKISKVVEQNQNKISYLTLSKVVLAIAEDFRVLIIVLCDKLDGIRNIYNGASIPLEKRALMARAALELYASICHKLGLEEIKWETQDLSMKILYPETYYKIKKLVNKTRKEREEFLKKFVNVLSEKLKAKGLRTTIYSRVKSFYSINQKMIKKNRSFNEIMDLLAVRIICNSIKDCYLALSLVHEIFKHVPGTLDDYIAKPKSNNYQSIHTNVEFEGQIIEVQIRTWEMHAEAEGGISAHWVYKEQIKDKHFDKKLEWAKQLIELNRNSKEILNKIKLEFGGTKIFVFTPKGEIIELEKNSTPIDFAYTIHSDLGNTIAKAKVNGKIVPLNYVLDNGETVEIITSKRKTIKRAWLNFVKTTKARQKIRNALKINGLTKKIK
jgi:RelA/SpoT family (p)ppGpp synthetase